MCWDILRRMRHTRNNRRTSSPVSPVTEEVARALVADFASYVSPGLENSTEILQSNYIEKLQTLLPNEVIGHKWIRLFSTINEGEYIDRLYEQVSAYKIPLILIIKDADEAVFGAVMMEALSLKRRFSGIHGSYLFTFHPEFKAFPSTNKGGFFARARADSLTLGIADDFFGLWIDGALSKGCSRRCPTFYNDILSASPDFTINVLEVWGFKE